MSPKVATWENTRNITQKNLYGLPHWKGRCCCLSLDFYWIFPPLIGDLLGGSKKKKKYTWENELPARNISCSACAVRLISCPVLCQLHKLKTIPSIPIPPSTHKTFGMFEESFSLRLCLQKLFSSAKFTGNLFFSWNTLKRYSPPQSAVCLSLALHSATRIRIREKISVTLTSRTEIMMGN